MFSFSSSSTRGLTPLVPLAAAVHLLVLSCSVSVADPAMALKLNLKPERELQRQDGGCVSPTDIESTDLGKISQSVISKLEVLRSERSIKRRIDAREELQELRLNFLKETIEAFQEMEFSKILGNSLRNNFLEVFNFLEVDIVQVEQSKQKLYDLSGKLDEYYENNGDEYYENNDNIHEIEVVNIIAVTVNASVFFLECLDLMQVVSAAYEKTIFSGRGTTPPPVQVQAGSWLSKGSHKINENITTRRHRYSFEKFLEEHKQTTRALKHIEEKMTDLMAQNNIFSSIKDKLITAEQFGGLISFMKRAQSYGFERKYRAIDVERK